MNKIFDYIDFQQEEMLQLWEKLVNIDSGSKCKEGIDKVAEAKKSIEFNTARVASDSEAVDSMQEGSLSLGNLTKLADILRSTSPDKYDSYEGVAYLGEHISEYKESAAGLIGKASCLVRQETESLFGRYSAAESESGKLPQSMEGIDGYISLVNRLDSELRDIRLRFRELGLMSNETFVDSSTVIFPSDVSHTG